MNEVEQIVAAMGVTLAAAFAVPAAHGAEAFDNPTIGVAPCIVLNHYDMQRSREPGGSGRYTARAAIGNICGRSVEVALCFNYVEAVGDEAKSCYGGVLRPWSESAVEKKDAPARLAGPVYQWRFVP